MRFFRRNAFLLSIAAATLLGAVAADAQGQSESKKSKGEFCSSWNSGGSRQSYNEIREFDMPAIGRLDVDGGRNGGISVRGGNVSQISVKACVNAWAATEAEANAIASSVRIDTGSTIRAENSSDSNWSVSYQITVPRNTDLNLKANNGGISVSGVDGRLEFETRNGGISVSDLAGDVRGRTTNGGISAVLKGSTWIGSGLDLETTNGGVKLYLPETYSANIEAGTVNGGYRSDISALNITTEDTKAVGEPDRVLGR